MVARSHLAHRGADRFDHARAFMAEHHGMRRIAGIGRAFEVRVADASRDDAHQHLVRLRP